MTLLLDVIAAANVDHIPAHQSDYPTILDPQTCLRRLRHSADEPPNPTLLVYPVSGFKLSHNDTQIAELSNKTFAELTRYMKNTKAMNRQGFETKVGKYLNKVKNLKFSSDVFSPIELIKRFGHVMGRDVTGLIVECCVLLEMWDWVEVLIFNKLVPHFSFTKLIDQLIAKNKTNLICECVKSFSDLKAGDIYSILRYFLVPSKDAYLSMSGVAKEWETQAVGAVELASDKTLKVEELALARMFVILLMVAYDEFSDAELCLHYLFKAMSVDELVLTSAVSKLNRKELMTLIRYLGKWLRKFDKFPQAFSCPEESLASGPKACNWVPKIEDVINCLGLVIDEHFSTLVLHQEFQDEMMSSDGLVGSLVLDARLCFSSTNIIENLVKANSRDKMMHCCRGYSLYTKPNDKNRYK